MIATFPFLHIIATLRRPHVHLICCLIPWFIGWRAAITFCMETRCCSYLLNKTGRLFYMTPWYIVKNGLQAVIVETRCFVYLLSTTGDLRGDCNSYKIMKISWYNMGLMLHNILRWFSVNQLQETQANKSKFKTWRDTWHGLSWRFCVVYTLYGSNSLFLDSWLEVIM